MLLDISKLVLPGNVACYEGQFIWGVFFPIWPSSLWFKGKTTSMFLQSPPYPITLRSYLLAALNREHYSPHCEMHIPVVFTKCKSCTISKHCALHILVVSTRCTHCTCCTKFVLWSSCILLHCAMRIPVVFTKCTWWDAKAPSDPCFLPRPIEFLGFCALLKISRGRGDKGGPSPLFIRQL